MNLIEQLGGYEKAKKHFDSVKFVSVNVILGQELLEYRRANNIFERGDYVVVNNHPFNWLCKFDYYCTEERVMLHKYDRGSKDTAFQTWPKSKDVRHATDEEIAAGHKL